MTPSSATTWIACHTAENGTRTVVNGQTVYTGGGYKGGTPTSETQFIGCYSEEGQGANEINGFGMWIGGPAHNVVGSGAIFRRNFIQNAVVKPLVPWVETAQPGAPWQNVGGGQETMGYMVDGTGIIHLKGTVSGGIPGNEFMGLGWARPAKDLRVAVAHQSGIGVVRVLAANGSVALESAPGWAPGNWISLSGVSFPAAQ